MRFTFSWSGGKDSALAFHIAKEQGHEPASLIHILNEKGSNARAHDLPFFILQQQALRMGLPLLAEPASWEDYTGVFVKNLVSTQKQHQVDSIVFGDIDLQYHLDWEEKVAIYANLKAYWPLKHQSRLTVAKKIIEAGIRAVIISVQDHLSPEWLGKEFNNETLSQLINAGIDPCGEDGSFHTLVYDAPFFSEPLIFSLGSIRQESQHHLIEILP